VQNSFCCWQKLKLWPLSEMMANAEGFSDVFKRIWQHMSQEQQCYICHDRLELMEKA